MKKKTAKQKFAEVRTDYTEQGTGNIAIDAWLTGDDDEGGRTVAWVSPDGEIIKGTNPTCEADDLECSLVQEAIENAKYEQGVRKQELADNVITDLKEQFKYGEYDVLNELLLMIPSKNLIQALPEEKWKEYPIEIKEGGK